MDLGSVLGQLQHEADKTLRAKCFRPAVRLGTGGRDRAFCKGRTNCRGLGHVFPHEERAMKLNADQRRGAWILSASSAGLVVAILLRLLFH